MKPARFLTLLLAAVFLLAVSCGSPPEGNASDDGSSDDGPSGSSTAPEGAGATAAETTSVGAPAEETTSPPETTAAKAAAGGAKGEGTANRGSEKASETKRKPAPAAKEVVKVDIRGLGYLPGAITVSPGTTVRWTNGERALHTVTSEDQGGPLRSAKLEKGESYEYTFRKRGQYDYYCTVHPFMKSGVTVE